MEKPENGVSSVSSVRKATGGRSRVDPNEACKGDGIGDDISADRASSTAWRCLTRLVISNGNGRRDAIVAPQRGPRRRWSRVASNNKRMRGGRAGVLLPRIQTSMKEDVL